MVDRSLLKSLLRMLADLQIYKEAFEKKFLNATEKLYAAEGQRLINERDVPEYLLHVEKRLKEENDRLLHYLDPSSEVHLIKSVEKQLISEHLSSILTKGLDDLLEADRKNELKLMYFLLGKVAGGNIIYRMSQQVFDRNLAKKSIKITKDEKFVKVCIHSR